MVLPSKYCNSLIPISGQTSETMRLTYWGEIYPFLIVLVCLGSLASFQIFFLNLDISGVRFKPRPGRDSWPPPFQRRLSFFTLNTFIISLNHCSPAYWNSVFIRRSNFIYVHLAVLLLYSACNLLRLEIGRYLHYWYLLANILFSWRCELWKNDGDGWSLQYCTIDW